MHVLGLIFTAFLAFIACDEESGSPTTLPTRVITVSDTDSRETLTVELATTPLERQQGLMFRQSLDEDRGMLFLFPGESRGGFWMRNTYVALTIAYLDANGRVIALKDGKPLDETILDPGVPYHAVLEVNQGWFQRHGFGIGSLVELPGDVPGVS